MKVLTYAEPYHPPALPIDIVRVGSRDKRLRQS